MFVVMTKTNRQPEVGWHLLAPGRDQCVGKEQFGELLEHIIQRLAAAAEILPHLPPGLLSPHLHLSFVKGSEVGDGNGKLRSLIQQQVAQSIDDKLLPIS